MFKRKLFNQKSKVEEKKVGSKSDWY